MSPIVEPGCGPRETGRRLALTGPPQPGRGLADCGVIEGELGSFLRSRRKAVSPAEVGLPEGPRWRTPGLPRAELATLAGVSVDYLIRLEQGRDTHPSAQVLAAPPTPTGTTSPTSRWPTSTSGDTDADAFAARLSQAAGAEFTDRWERRLLGGKRTGVKGCHTRTWVSCGWRSRPSSSPIPTTNGWWSTCRPTRRRRRGSIGSLVASPAPFDQ